MVCTEQRRSVCPGRSAIRGSAGKRDKYRSVDCRRAQSGDPHRQPACERVFAAEKMVREGTEDRSATIAGSNFLYVSRWLVCPRDDASSTAEKNESIHFTMG